MIFTVLFLIAIITFIFSKTNTILLRNKLDTNNKKRILIASFLVVLFLITSVTLPYPESLYWFIGLGVVFVSLMLSFNVLKSEFKRFLSLNAKNKIVNVLFYSLLILVTNIYL